MDKIQSVTSKLYYDKLFKDFLPEKTIYPAYKSKTGSHY